MQFKMLMKLSLLSHLKISYFLKRFLYLTDLQIYVEEKQRKLQCLTIVCSDRGLRCTYVNRTCRAILGVSNVTRDYAYSTFDKSFFYVLQTSLQCVFS